MQVVVELGALGRGSLEEVAEDGFIGEAAEAGILEVDEDGVEVLELGVGGATVGVVGAIKRGDVEAGGGVGFGGEVFGVLATEDAVFRAEEGGQVGLREGLREIGEENVDGSAAVGVEAGLIGKEAKVGEGGEGGEVGGL